MFYDELHYDCERYFTLIIFLGRRIDDDDDVEFMSVHFTFSFIRGKPYMNE